MTEKPDIIWDPIKKRFKAYLLMHGDYQFLGYFQTPEDAAQARTASAWLHVQDFAGERSSSSHRYPRHD
jgi:non-ribosomal peptide synthetase component E (peptide arylation enzyme)